MKALRLTVLAVEAALLLAALALGAAAWWLFATEEGLAWVAARLPSLAGGRVVLEQASGTLMRGFEVGRLVYEQPGLRIEVNGIHAKSNPLALAAGRVSLSELRARAVEVRLSGPDKPPALPERLALPLPVSVGEAVIDELQIDNKGQRFGFRDIHVSAYGGGPLTHRVDFLSAQSPWGALALTGSIGTAQPYPVRAAVAFSRPDPAYGLGAAAELTGDLARMLASVTGSVAGAATTAQLALAPFSAIRIETADIRVEGVDAARFRPGAPRTALALAVRARGEADNRFSGTVTAKNELVGPLERNGLPVSGATARFSFAANELRGQLDALVITLSGGGRLEGRAAITPERSRLELQSHGVDLKSLRSNLARTDLRGPIKLDWTPTRQSATASLTQDGMSIAGEVLRQGDTLQFNSVRAEANGGAATGSGTLNLSGTLPFQARVSFSALDPARFGDYPTGSLNGSLQAQGRLAAPLQVHAQWSIAQSTLLGRALASDGSATLGGESAQRVDARANVAGNRLAVRGAFGRPGDALLFDVDARQLARLQPGFAGSVRAQGRLTGSWENPRLALDAQASALSVPDQGSIGALQAKATLGRSPTAPFDVELSARTLSIRGVTFDRAAVHGTGTVASHHANLSVAGPGFDADAEVHGSWDEARGWSGQIDRMRNRGTYPLALVAPADLAVARDHARLGTFRATLGEGRLLVREAEWEPARLASSGEFTGLPAQWLLFAAGIVGQLESSLRLDGQWDLRTREALDGTLSLKRSAGDLRFPGGVAFGLERLTVSARFDAGRMQAVLDVASRLGSLNGKGEISPAPQAKGIGFSGASPVSFRASFELADIGPVANLFVTQARLSGRINAALNGGGTLGEPSVQGQLAADGVALDVPAYGVYLREGRARARLEGDALHVVELSLKGGDGQLTANGAIPLRGGEAGARLGWQAKAFRVLERPDMRLVVSGDGSAGLSGGKAQKFELSGKMHVDQGLFDLGEERLPQVGDDVIVLGETRAPAKQGVKVPVALHVEVDLGNSLKVQGRGFDGKIGGQLRVTTSESGDPLAYGKLIAVNSTFEAYGQRLQIDPGTLVFDGPLANPALQVTAWRRNQAVEAGVQLSGTVRNPQIQLVSNPAVPEGERLSWLVLGRAPSDASGGDLGLLQTAAAALFARGNSVPATTRIARAFGFDELSLRNSATGAGDVSTRVVALGKRLSDRLYITYEQGLGTVATNLIKLDYSLTQRFSVRAETGTASGLGIFYRYSWD